MGIIKESLMKNTLLSVRYTLIFYTLLSLPLVVYLLPGFATSYEEDLLLLALFIYLLLRTLNDARLPLGASWQTVLNFGCLVCVYGIGWFGLVRGYGETWGRGIAVFPLLLFTAAAVRPKPFLSDSTVYRVLLLALGVLSVVFFAAIAVLNLFFWGIPTIFDFPESSAVIPMLLTFPLLGCLALMSRSGFRMDRGRDHLPILLAVTIAFLGVWSGNAATWADWYRAGVLERAWTPHRYDAPEEIAEAERKPFEAAAAYLRVHQRLSHKGDIPRYLNWPFFMKYRMAFQAMRKENLAVCLDFLPPSQVTDPGKFDLLQKLYHTDFLLGAQSSEPNPEKNNRYWIDVELDPNSSAFYVLDTWGRVFKYEYERFWPMWTPGERFCDALDLEIAGDTFLVLREDGRIITSKPTPLLPQDARVQPLEGRAIDLELLPNQKTLLVTTTHGEPIAFGPWPEAFPDWRRLRFDRSVVADLELDPDGRGYYLLDIHGAVHSNHTGDSPSIPHKSPIVPNDLLPYWVDRNVAVDLELDPEGRGVYVYNRFGELFTLAATPYLETYRPPKPYRYRGVGLAASKNGRLNVMEANGNFIQLP